MDLDGPLIQRATCSYENLSHKFKFDKKREFKTQYAHIYFNRLQKLRGSLHEAAKHKWGAGVRIVRISELKDLKFGEKCCIVGTLFKSMELKPSILKEISEKHSLVPLLPRKKYTSKTDFILLEDEAQRIHVTGDFPTADLVTGITTALLGYINDAEQFYVEKYCFPGDAPSFVVTEDNCENELSDESNRYVALVSGLNVGSSHCDQLSVQLLVDYITGSVGGATDRTRCSGSVVRVILAGNCVTDKPAVSSIATKDNVKAKYHTKNYSAQSVEAVKELDGILTQLASCLPVDVMPGSHDPTNHMLPQHPLHRCMFPQASRYPTLQCVTNPYHARIGGKLLLGTSGQNVDDIMRFSSYTDPMSVLEHTLSWKHLAPTAPDTLSCFPYTSHDPFVLETRPSIYFAANQPSLQHKIIEDAHGGRTCLVTVPNYDVTHTCVIVDLKTLKCTELQLHTSLLSSTTPVSMETSETMTADDETDEEVNYMELYQQEDDDDAD